MDKKLRIILEVLLTKESFMKKFFEIQKEEQEDYDNFVSSLAHRIYLDDTDYMNSNYATKTRGEAKEVAKAMIDHFKNKQINQLNKEETMFEQPVTVGITHTVNDTDVSTMSKADLLICVIKLESNVDQLKAIRSKSKAVKKEIAKQNKILKVVVKYLDAK